MNSPSSSLRLAGLIAVAVMTALLLWPTPVSAQYDGDPSDEIVYIDSFGFIRIVDPGQTNQNTAIQWRSEEGDWDNLALGDVNHDGDLEIIALRETAAGGLLTVYDPVVNDSAVPIDGRINGVPWSRLFDLELPGEPVTVTSGNFSALSSADEFAVGVNIVSADDDELFVRQDVSIFRSIDPQGFDWFPIVDAHSFRNEWTMLDAGNLDNVGLDELILLDDDLSALEVYRVENGLDDIEDRIFNSESETKSWSDVTAGRFNSSRIQMAAVREAPLGLSNLLVMEYDEVAGTWMDQADEQFLPSPRVVFDGDINNDGTDELFMMRSVPSTAGNRARLFMRNLGGDTLPNFEDVLDADNGYRAGAAGDTDGDGRDEVVIMRDNRIRIYTDPENGTGSKSEYIRATNSRTIAVGDVDTNGYLPPPAFVVTPESLTLTLARGQRAGPEELTVANIATHGNFPFTVEIAGEIGWLDVVPLREQRTPATLSIYVDARELRIGSYVGEFTLVAPDAAGVTNNELVVTVNLTVSDGLSVTPGYIIDRRDDCAGNQAGTVTTVNVAGAGGRAVTAQVVDSNGEPVPWATVTPATGTSPLTLEVTTTPAQDEPHLAAARLVVQTEDGDTRLTGAAQVELQCGAATLMLPFVNRN